MSAARIDPGAGKREEVLLPPTGFRKAIPVRVKLDVVIRQEGKCAVTGEKLGTLAETQFDHRPALATREWDPVAEDTIPPANCPNHIRAIRIEPHKEATRADVKGIAKTRRLRKSGAAHDDAMAAKEPGKKRPRRGTIRSRGFQKRRKG